MPARLHRIAGAATFIGGALLVLLALWITYGVLMRFVFRSPDELVVEVSSLILLTLSFIGLPAALMADAFPKVTVLTDRLRGRAARVFWRINLTLVVLGGAFYALVAGFATWRTWSSGAGTDLLGWPEFLFWFPSAVITVVFVLLGSLLLLGGPASRPPVV